MTYFNKTLYLKNKMLQWPIISELRVIYRKWNADEVMMCHNEP